MSTAIDLAALGLESGPKVSLGSGPVNVSGAGTDYTGWSDVSTVYVRAKTVLRDGTRGFARIDINIQGSDDGDSWTTLQTLSFGAGGSPAAQTATISISHDHLRASWDTTGAGEWTIEYIDVVPAAFNTPGGGGGGLYDAYAYLRDEKASGTNGGQATATTWNTRTLNTEVFDPDGIVSLSSNQFTLAAGTYYIVARAPALFVGKTRTRIRNITDSSTVGLGASTFCDAGAVSSVPDCSVEARVTIAGSTAFELQHYTTNAGTFAVELGTPTSTGDNEVYSEVWIYREPA